MRAEKYSSVRYFGDRAIWFDVIPGKPGRNHVDISEEVISWRSV